MLFLLVLKNMQNLIKTILGSLEVTSGCTEPAAIAFCASFIGKYLDETPVKIALAIDQRTYKNAFAAGIPGGGDRRGAEWALVFGLVMACPENRLSIFAGLDADALAQADQLHAIGLVTVELIDTEGLLIHISARGKNNNVEARIRSGHTRVDLLEVNGEAVVFEGAREEQIKTKDAFGEELFDPENWPAVIDELYQDSELQQTIRQGIAYNMAAALHGKKYVEAVNSGLENLVMGAIYARMNGDPIPVMSCAGSGNKGLTCMVPVVAKARESTMGEEKEIRAVLMSVLLTNLITSRFGEVSSVCGAQYAAGAGVIGGILYLKERLDLFDGSYNNFVSAIGGGFCDGAKGSCSMRGNVAVSAAFNAITHAQAGFTVSARDGFLGNNFKETLEHLSRYNPLVARFELETIKILQDK
ncbi:MAG: hypothetical protein DSY80_07040 [Desulfocapsa sp.]|nr:MAG: hypothetical protein DSY80_07040 [Desulfocapsa sp.]